MENKKHVHTTRIAMRWGDMDALGHVNNTVYFRYMEQARIEWLQQLGSDFDARHGPVLVNAQCSFLRQLKYPCDVEVKSYIGAIGRSSFEASYEIRRADLPEVVFAEGTAKIVWVDFDLEKSMPLPDDLRQLLTNPVLAA
ncbi:acyl-CoA thioesterase [Collimonas antrihumi]|uniref:acyl-CoA thioesterase n=1 Tax=Collimonas antrihumi TaxID=1940615 RepID=UPI001B8ABE05|nr:thioesterase family protein [Collimonas antrihumi]